MDSSKWKFPTKELGFFLYPIPFSAKGQFKPKRASVKGTELARFPLMTTRLRAIDTKIKRTKISLWSILINLGVMSGATHHSCVKQTQD